MASKDGIIAELRALVEKQAKQIVAQAKQIDALTQEVAQLKLQLAKANKDSSNSSKSPSSDITNAGKDKKNKKPGRPRKRKIGGQPGHRRNLREPLPPERVDESFDYEIDPEEVLRLQLTPTGEFDTIQQIELPDSPVIVTEHRFALYQSPDGTIYYPYAPEVHNGPIFGPRLLATIGWLKSRAHCSYTTIDQYFDDVLGIPVSRGYLSKLCTGIVSDSLAEAYEEAKAAIPEQPQLGSDETSFKDNGKKNWVWCISSAIMTVFHISKSRSRAVLEELVGDEFKGYLNFDYFSANCSFAWNYDVKAQYCWAHLIRDMRFLLKHPDKKTRDWAKQLLDRSRRLFLAWHSREEMTQSGFERSMKIHRDRFLEVVRSVPKSSEAANLAARFSVVEVSDGSTYDMSQDYFRFMFAAGIEPTNNHSEQQIRHVVIDRRITQGTRSESGQRFNERMWTAIATCKKQDKNFFEYLHASIEAKLSGTRAPSLIGR
jgi:transposase